MYKYNGKRESVLLLLLHNKRIKKEKKKKKNLKKRQKKKNKRRQQKRLRRGQQEATLPPPFRLERYACVRRVIFCFFSFFIFFFYSIILISDELHCSQRIVSRSRRRDSHSSRLFFSRLVRIRGAALTAPCTPICATYCARDLPFSFFFLKSAVFLVRRPFRV